VLAYVTSGRGGLRKSIMGREQMNLTIPGWEVVPMLKHMLLWTPGKEWAAGSAPIQPLSLEQRAVLTTSDAMNIVGRAMGAVASGHLMRHDGGWIGPVDS
jgi:hypothetical protein